MIKSSELIAASPPILVALGDVETKRLLLRRFVAEDVYLLAPIFAKEEVWRFPYSRGFSMEETRGFLENQIAAWDTLGYGLWLAIEGTSQQAIGFVGLSVPTFLPEILPAVEVGWRFDPDFWGRGYATEAAEAALKEGFTTLGFDRICSVPQSDNPPSGKVCQRIGMTFERQVAIPANERRGALSADLYWMNGTDWRDRKTVS